MLKINFVQNLPVRDRIVVARLVPLAEFIREASLGVPGEQPGVVLGHFLHSRVAEFSPLFIIPTDLRGICRIGDWFICLVHPLRDSAEV